MTTVHEEEPDQASLMKKVRALSKTIVDLQHKFDEGKLKSHEDALLLQNKKMERQALQGLMVPIRVVPNDG